MKTIIVARNVKARAKMMKGNYISRRVLNELDKLCSKCKNYFECKKHEFKETLLQFIDNENNNHIEHQKSCIKCHYRVFYHDIENSCKICFIESVENETDK